MRSISILLALAMIASYLPAGAGSGWIAIVSPTPGDTLGGKHAEVSVSFSTGTSEKVTRVDIVVEGRPYATKSMAEPSPRSVVSFVIDTTKFKNGAHSIIAKVYSGNTLLGSASTRCGFTNQSVDVQPPVVKFVGIKKDKVYSGAQQIEVSANDNSEKDPLVSVFIDKSLKLIKNTPPYRYNWDTTQYDNGRHVLEAYAYDEAGNKGDAQAVEVTVANSKSTAALSVEPEAKVAEVPTRTETPTVKSVTPVERHKPAASAARSEISSTEPAERINQPAAKPNSDVTAQQPITEVAKPQLQRLAKSASVTAAPSIKASVRPMPLAKAAQPKVGEIRAIKPSTLAPALRSIDSTPAVKLHTAPAKVVEPSVVAEKPVEPVESSKPAPRQLPEKKPITETVQTASVARLDQSFTVADLPVPEPIPGPDPEKPTATEKPAAAVRHPAPAIVHHTAAVHTAPKMVEAPKNYIVAKKPAVATIAQKISKSTSKLAVSVRMARAPKPELPTLENNPAPTIHSVRLKTQVHEGRMVAGLRGAIEAAGGEIAAWDRHSHTAIAVFGGKRIVVTLGQDTAQVAGHEVELKCAPYVSGQGRMMVDIHLLKRVLGSRLQSDERTGNYRIISA